jgi:hypothetical protein
VTLLALLPTHEPVPETTSALDPGQRLDELLNALVRKIAPDLLALPGAGTETAAALLEAAGDNPGRLVSEAAFAHLCGAAPIPASSGRTVRHRFNPGGHRQANEALWRIVLVRMKSHAPTRAYVARRTAEGLSKREIMRCLKRYVARDGFGVQPPGQVSGFPAGKQRPRLGRPRQPPTGEMDLPGQLPAPGDRHGRGRYQAQIVLTPTLAQQFDRAATIRAPCDRLPSQRWTPTQHARRRRLGDGADVHGGRNPDPSSRLPYLLCVPLADGPLLLKAAAPWPRTAKVYCHRADGWPDHAELLEQVPVRSCVRRGVAIDLGILGRRLLDVCVKFSEDEVESGVRSISADTLSDQPLSGWPAGREADRTLAQRTAAVGLTDRGSLVELALMADRLLRLADDDGFGPRRSEAKPHWYRVRQRLPRFGPTASPKPC